MKILFLTQTFPRFAGDSAGPFIRDLARGLVRRGDEVTVLTPHAPGVRPQWRDQGVCVITFRYAPQRWELLGYGRSLDADERMKIGAAVVAPLYLIAARRAARAILRRQRYDLLHAHWIVPNALVAAPLAARIPLAIGLHGSDVFLAERTIVRIFAGRALGRAQLLTGCSPELIDRVCRLGLAPAERHVLPYGIDTEKFSPAVEGGEEWRRRLRIPARAPVILSVGRMATKKGYQILLPLLGRMAAAHPTAHVVLAGGGGRLEELKALASAWRDRVHFPGAIDRQRLPGLYRAADIFVLPAVHDSAGNVDGLPNVILEAMASGLPVVASDVSGIPLAVDPEVTGLLVPEADAEALFAALDRLLSGLEQAREMGMAGRRKAERELTWDAVAARYQRAYRNVVRR